MCRFISKYLSVSTFLCEIRFLTSSINLGELSCCKTELIMHLINSATLVEIHQTANTMELKERQEYEGRVEINCRFFMKETGISW